jgi:predicted hydrocarbon binding protein
MNRKTMEIRNKTHQDPVAELPMIEAYMRWALIAIEDAMGKQVLETILSENGLAQFIDNYPPEKMRLSQKITVGDYANLSTGLMKFYGQTGISEVIRLGRTSAKPALENQGKLFNMAARTALKLLPVSLQIKTVLEGIQTDLEKIYKPNYVVGVRIEDRGKSWAYIDDCCALCAGKEADVPICWNWVGTLEESLQWLTGKEFEIEQVECRAMGTPACVWEVNKTPKK